MTYNKHLLVVQYSDTLDLLTPNTPLGPVDVLKRTEETVKRLEQLVGIFMNLKIHCQLRAKGTGSTKVNEAIRNLRNLVVRVRKGLAPEITISKRENDDGPAGASGSKTKK